MGNIYGLKRLVLDVLKPHQPVLPDFAETLGKLDGVMGINITLIEVDAETESVKITVEGNNLNYNQIKEKIDSLGAVIHSVDQVVAGTTVVEEVRTAQDNHY
ncbi:MAG: DUF211 domain-containing protein [Candidatus Jordarchaeum sp.]|uniref:DUF211 domain-containing protein n=1 Tax=Candidatus Jordarchaeum sp. TaxID=2823881 RepID=UPI00404A656B